MASLMELGEKFILRDNFELDVGTFLKKRNCQVLIVMGIEIYSNDVKQEDQIRRDILILPFNETAQKIGSGLKEKPELQLREKGASLKNGMLFEQGDVSYSRKKVMPIIKNICGL